MTDTQQPADPPSPPRLAAAPLGMGGMVFALAIVLGGTEMVSGLTSVPRGVVVFLLVTAFVLFVALIVLPAAPSSPAIAVCAAVVLVVALVVSWSARPAYVAPPAGLVVINDGQTLTCGEITSMDDDFVAITAKVRDPSYPSVRTDAPELLPVAHIVSVVSVKAC